MSGRQERETGVERISRELSAMREKTDGTRELIIAHLAECALRHEANIELMARTNRLISWLFWLILFTALAGLAPERVPQILHALGKL